MELSHNLHEIDAETSSNGSERKNIKISPNDEIKDKELTLESLPLEILIEIFDFLPWKDLLSLTLVSKDFNTIISNSSKLLSKIKFIYDYWKCKKVWLGTRKYPNVKILCDETKLCSINLDEKFVKNLFVQFISPNIRDFKSDGFKELREFLIKFENLEELYVNYESEILENCEILPLPKISLKKLRFLYNSPEAVYMLFKLFSNWQVNELIMNNPLDRHSEYFTQFLKNQNNLQHLETTFSDFKLLSEVNFKLKTLKINFVIQNKSESLAKFLENHQDSLIELSIYRINDETAETLNKFTKLQKLTVKSGIISKKLKSSTIENLRLECNDYENLFPSVKELYLYESSLTTTGDMKYLHKLTIFNTELDEISIPTVKVLTLNKIRTKTRPFKFETSNLDELEILVLKSSQKWIIDYLDRDETNLKKFRISQYYVKDDSIEMNDFEAALERNFSKIQSFEIS